jgi:hypothetical protein
VHGRVLTLYQAEWCPYSSAVRQRRTELGIDFVAKQVAPRQKDRKGKHEIPLLTNGDGERFEGTAAIFEFLARLPSGEREHEHRAVRSCSPRKASSGGRVHGFRTRSALRLKPPASVRSIGA